MSTLILGSDLRGLADRLADALDADAKTGDFFSPVQIVVPNRFLRKWLRLHLARKLGVAINLTYLSLEEALWQLLRQVDPNPSASPPDTIDANTYRLMVLSVLLEEREPALAPLHRYLQRQGPDLTRLSCRRAWHLADRLGKLLADYEYHRQDALIQPWLRNEPGRVADGDFPALMERAQRALFQHIIREGGKRDLLNREQSCKTFPQYAMELMENARPRQTERGVIHCFGFTQLSELHARVVGWLGQYFDMRLYFVNVFTPRLREVGGINQLKPAVDSHRTAVGDGAGQLLHDWGIAGLESLHVVADRLPASAFNLELLPPRHAKKKRTASVLSRLQDQLLGKTASRGRLAQDTSLQIVGCPGVMREVETAYNSILHNLQIDPALRQTDIAVLVTDMPRYRAALLSAFERPPAALQYNLVDFNAAGVSTYGQALLGILDLALESFSRAQVFAVILNPCFLARLGVDRASAMTWLDWAEQLGIYQGWDAKEKEQQGYPASPLYAWQLGMRRLRLGRYMQVAGDDAVEPAPRFADVIPFADLASGQREQLDAFCRAIEGLLPSLHRLRSWHTTGARWAGEIERLMQMFLEVPADRPEEAQVRDALLGAIAQLERWDVLRDASRRDFPLPLALVREYVHGQLESMPGSRGEYLIGGVTLATLQPMRPVPFEIVYVLGLGDDLFPGSNALSSFDLRAERLPGDIRPAENRLHDFLTTMLAAQQKLYLLYNNHDLTKDQDLLPAVALQQLQRYLGDNVLQSAFQPVKAPAQGDDPELLIADARPAHQDVLVQYREAERCLAIASLRHGQCLALTVAQERDWAARWKKGQHDFAVVPEVAEPAVGSVTVSLRQLRKFLELPAMESLRRHLRIDADYDDVADDDEPLVTPGRAVNALVRQAVERLIRAAALGNADEAVAGWQERFRASYADARLRCQVPDAGFGAIDQAAIVDDLQERIHGQGGLESFLKAHAGATFCGPLLLGEAPTQIGARLRFSALSLRPGHELPADAPREIRIVGSTTFAWSSPERFEILVVSTDKKLDRGQVVSPLIEPALMHLALLANPQPNGDRPAPRSWLGNREVRLHAAAKSGIVTWTFPPGSIKPAEAAEYLTALARDLLDRGSFDLLPLRIMQEKKLLPRALGGPAGLTPEDFRTQLLDAIDEARENTFGPPAVPLLVQMIRATVPADALAKVRRRFELLDRGPAALRQPACRTRKGAPA